MKDATFKKGGFPTGEKKQVCKFFTSFLQLAYVHKNYLRLFHCWKSPLKTVKTEIQGLFMQRSKKTFSLRNSTWNSYYVYKRYEKLFRNFTACGIKYVSFVPESILGETFFQRMRRKVITAAGPKRENKRKKVFRRKRFWKLLKGEFS